MDSYKEYYEVVGEKPNSLVVEALKDFTTTKSKALDLGAGNLRDSKFLLSKGFKKIVAVDKDEVTRKFLVPKIDLHITAIEDFIPETNTFDFALSCNTLFFLDQSRVSRILHRVFAGLKPKGIFVFNVLGNDDDWVLQQRPVYSYSDRELETLAVRTGYEVLGLGEGRYNSYFMSQEGPLPKFWHQLSLAVRKP